MVGSKALVLGEPGLIIHQLAINKKIKKHQQDQIDL